MRKFACFLAAFLGLMSVTWAQTSTISGKVTDSKDGSPLSGVTVRTKVGTSGVKTDAAGSFTITIPARSVLVFSFVGYQSEEVVIGRSLTVDVALKALANDLTEVVVTGIKTVRKAEYAGAVSRIDRTSIENKPVGSFDQLLQGAVPGLLAITSSGQPGSATNVVIRGSGSITGGTNPLYVIDGIPVEAAAFQGINANDIQTLDVLKDASASSLYGSRGSAGVIVITTRRGTAGKMKLSYSGQVGVKSKPDFAFQPMNTTQLLKAQENYGKIAGGTAAMPGWFYSKVNPRYATLTAAQQTAADQTLDSISKINTNWADYIFRNGTFSNHQISVSGGAGKTRVYSSAEVYNEEGTTFRTDMKRLSLRNNIDYADDKLTFSVSTSLAYTKRNFQQSTTTNSTQNPFLVVNIAAPYATVYKPDGYNYATGNGALFVAANQLDYNRYDENYNNQFKGLMTISTAYKITNDLTAGFTAGADYRETQNTNYASRLAFLRTISASPTVKAGSLAESLGRFLQVDVRPYLNYIKTFSLKHKVDVGLYGEYLGQSTKSISYTGYGIDPRTPGTPAAITQGDATNLLFTAAGGGKSQNALSSGLAIATYTYDNKYSFTGSYRKDGSSKLPSATRWQGFYSVGGIWTVSNENFLSKSKFVNSLRLRASYGGSGNSDNFPFGDFGYIPTWAANGNYSGLTTQYITSLGNPDLKWETVYQLNIGTDFSLLRNRIYGSIDVYDKRTKDLFVQRTLAYEATGGQNIQANYGELQNKGFEVDLSVDVVKTKDLVWTINGKVGYNKNKILDLGGIANYPSGTALITVGKPLGSNFEVKYAGVDAATGAPLYYKKDGTITTVYSADDKVQEFGTYEAPWKGGFGTSLLYKGFSLSALFSWQQGGYKTDNLEYFTENPVGFLSGGYNQSASLNMWQKPGDIATTPSPLYSQNFSSKLIHDASFLRLRDVTLSYTVAPSVLKGKFISRARIFVQGSNLFIWTKWRGMDPEAGVLNINLSEYPNPRAITAGVDITL